MRFSYSTTNPGQTGFDGLVRLPLILRSRDRVIETVGLVDSGASVSVLPHEAGVQLGAIWDDSKANIRIGGLSEAEWQCPCLQRPKSAVCPR